MHGNYYHGDFGLKMVECHKKRHIPPFLDQSPHGNNYHANISVVIITTGTLGQKWVNVKRKTVFFNFNYHKKLAHWPLCQIFCQNLYSFLNSGKWKSIYDTKTYALLNLTTTLDGLNENCSISTHDYGSKEIAAKMNEVRALE